jgi:hypothetical protein
LFLTAAFAQTVDRDAKWREDVDYLAAKIQETHPAPAFTISSDAFQAAVNDLKASVPQLSDAGVVAGLAKLAALLRDGHTNLNPMQSAGGLRSYAIRVKWFSDGLFVTAVGPATKAFMGKKVVSIGGVETEAVFEKLKPYISYENENWAREMSQSMFVSSDMLELAGAAITEGKTLWELEDTAGNRESVELQTGGSVTIDGPHLSRPGNPLYRQNPTLPYWFAMVPGQSILYIKYLRCEESPALPMEQFARELVEFMKTQPASRVAIDLRENTGGNTKWFDQLLAAVFAAYQSGEVPPPSGGTYALIGRRTFSSAAIHAAELRNGGAIVIGEPTGGNPSSFGEVKSFQLPNSKLTLICSSKKFEFEGYPFNTPVPVNIQVIFQSSDYLSDLDPFLEAVRTAVYPQV